MQAPKRFRTPTATLVQSAASLASVKTGSFGAEATSATWRMLAFDRVAVKEFHVSYQNMDIW